MRLMVRLSFVCALAILASQVAFANYMPMQPLNALPPTGNASDLMQYMQQQTQQALQVFVNVNYQNMSKDKQSFFDSDDKSQSLTIKTQSNFNGDN